MFEVASSRKSDKELKEGPRAVEFAVFDDVELENEFGNCFPLQFLWSGSKSHLTSVVVECDGIATKLDSSCFGPPKNRNDNMAFSVDFVISV